MKPNSAERERVPQGFNDTGEAYPEERLIHELFEEQVRHTPTAVALVCENQYLTYGELNSRADELSRHLRHKGIGPECVVGICVERSVEMVVGLLATLKAGGAYIPLDPNYPTERLVYMLEDARPRVLLTQRELKERWSGTTTDIVVLGDESSENGQGERGNFDAGQRQISSHNLAYVIYTSGSTGKPKGVMIEHRQVVNFLLSMRRQPGIIAEDCMLAVTTVSFDIAALELYLPLIVGAKVVVASREATMDANRLIAMIEAHAITVLQATPATWQLLLRGGWRGHSNVKVLCGGEALTTTLSGELVKRSGSLWNLYGPTETTIWSCVRRISCVDERGAVESIGRPISNTQIHLLDDRGDPVGVGVPGEIYIGGAGVARGYFNRAALTAERFVADSFIGDGRARLYKTGDLGLWRQDGTIEYLGRNDQQVKIRGFRIELGEIEAALERHSDVRAAVVVVREDSRDDKRLVAYFTLRHQRHPSIRDLRAHLKVALPEHMIPSAFVALDRFPLTPNGKVDRRAMPFPEIGAYICESYETPLGDVEEALSEIWKELLRIAQIGREDHFFELGGDSLMAMRLVGRISERFTVQLRALAIFRNPTLRKMAHLIEELRSPRTNSS